MRSWKRIDALHTACAKQLRISGARRKAFVAIAVAFVFVPAALAQNPLPDFRRADQRPKQDDARLSSLGFASTQSKRLRLYTDGSIDRVKSIGPAVDALYDALVQHFRPLPPARDASDFAVTAHLMAATHRFRNAGLIPRELPPFLNG